MYFLRRLVANFLLSGGEKKKKKNVNAIMRWVKFIKHVCEIHFKRTGKINAEVHMVHNQDPHLHGPATAEKRRRGEKKKEENI